MMFLSANNTFLKTKTYYTSKNQRQQNHLKIGVHLVLKIIRPTGGKSDQFEVRFNF